jgi:multisubunit Na+/H+ antiporter MnhB subunit
MQYAWFDIIGSVGVGLIILTYILLQVEKVRSTDLVYSLANGVGAVLILISLYYSFNFPSFIVEFFWLLISLFGVGKYLLKHG